MVAFEVKGVDAREFLGRVTAGPVKPLRPGEGARGLLLNGQSRVLAQFDILCLGETEFLLAAPEDCASALFDNLEKIHFAEDLTITPRPGHFGFLAGAEGGGEQRFSFTLPLVHWPSPVPGFAVSLATNEAAAPEGFHAARIKALVPWPVLDWSPETPALEAGFLEWVDRFKGCYPGQEVIELSLNVGRPARVLQAYETAGALAPGARIAFAEGGEAIVTSVAPVGARTRFLARVPWARKNAALGDAVLLKGWEFSR